MNKEITIYELTELLIRHEAPKNFKITWIDYDEYYTYDEERNWYFDINNEPLTINNEVRLTHVVNILDEENDEFEDITLINIPEIDTIENQRICTVEHRVNQLINNQKILIERLNKDE